jgi:hypothetical protein
LYSPAQSAVVLPGTSFVKASNASLRPPSASVSKTMSILTFSFFAHRSKADALAASSSRALGLDDTMNLPPQGTGPAGTRQPDSLMPVPTRAAPMAENRLH